MDVDGDAFDSLDPCPDIQSLFVHYNDLYFGGKLGACVVEWSSSRMTLCAGQCSYHKHGGCRVVLSEPLLKYRPTKDLKETLLHEMIHSYIFLQRIKDDGDHGAKFRELMTFINTATLPDPQRPLGGYNVSVYHNFHGEVDQYRTHWWECEKCGHTIKRSMNRQPQEADCRRRKIVNRQCQDPHCAHHMHIKFCGGQYKKTKEPEGYGRKRSRGRDGDCESEGQHGKKQKQKATSTPITKFFNKIEGQVAAGRSGTEEKPAGAFAGKAYFLGGEPGSGLPRPRLLGAHNPQQATSSTPLIPLVCSKAQEDPGSLKAQQIDGRPGSSVPSNASAGKAHFLGQAPAAYWPGVSDEGPSTSRPAAGPYGEARQKVEPAKPAAFSTPTVVDLVSCTGSPCFSGDRRVQGQGLRDPGAPQQQSWRAKKLEGRHLAEASGEPAVLVKDLSPTHSSEGCGGTVDVIDLSTEDDMDIDEVTVTMALGADEDRVICPGCGREWALACTTNEALAEHMDMCLSA